MFNVCGIIEVTKINIFSFSWTERLRKKKKEYKKKKKKKKKKILSDIQILLTW